MSAPTEDNAAMPPAWAAWVAQDADGSWWAYEAEPNQHDTGWYENEIGRSVRLEQGAANPDWQGSLRRILKH